MITRWYLFFFFQAEDGIRDPLVTGVQTCALPISAGPCEQTATRSFCHDPGSDTQIRQQRAVAARHRRGDPESTTVRFGRQRIRMSDVPVAVEEPPSEVLPWLG